MVAGRCIVFEHDQGVGARVWLAFPPIQHAPNRACGIIVQNQIGMLTLSLQPALDALSVLPNRCPDGVLSRSTISIGRGSRNVGLFLETVSKLIIGLPDVLAQDVAACGFVL